MLWVCYPPPLLTTARCEGSSQLAEWARGIAPRASHRSGLDTLASSGSCHRAKAAAFRCMSGSSRCRLTRPHVGDPLPSLHGHYTRLITTTVRSSPPLSGASVLSASRLEPLAPFPLASPVRFSRSVQEPG